MGEVVRLGNAVPRLPIEAQQVARRRLRNALARAIGVPARRINEIALGKRSISADTAVRLARALGTSGAFWMGLQADFGPECVIR